MYSSFPSTRCASIYSHVYDLLRFVHPTASVGFLSVRGAQVATLVGSGGDDETDDESVQGQSFGEDENEDHADEQLGLLGVGTHAGVTDDSDGETSGERRETHSEASAQMGITGVLRVRSGLVELSVDDDGGDETVDSQNTSHDDGDDGSHNQVGSHDTHGRDAHAGLGGAVGRSEVGKHDGRGDTHETKEGGAGNALLSGEQSGSGESDH